MRRATVRTEHEDAETARALARALRPDNTDEMETRVDDDTVETTVERATTGGLHSTLDDYLVNLTVAVQCTNETVQHANQDASASTNHDNT